MKRDYFKKLQELRISKGYTYQRMADKLKISKCFYWQIENKQRSLTYKMAFKIASILNTKPDKLFLDELKEDIKYFDKYKK